MIRKFAMFQTLFAAFLTSSITKIGAVAK